MYVHICMCMGIHKEMPNIRIILYIFNVLHNQLICFCSIKTKSPTDPTIWSNYSLNPQSLASTKCFSLSFRKKGLWRVLWNFPGLNVWKLWKVTSSFPASTNTLSRWVYWPYWERHNFIVYFILLLKYTLIHINEPNAKFLIRASTPI